MPASTWALPASVASPSAAPSDVSSPGLNFADRLALMLLAANTQTAGTTAGTTGSAAKAMPTVASAQLNPTDTGLPSISNDLAAVQDAPVAASASEPAQSAQPQQAPPQQAMPQQIPIETTLTLPPPVDLAKAALALGPRPAGPRNAGAPPLAAGDAKPVSTRKLAGTTSDADSSATGVQASGDLPSGPIPLQMESVLLPASLPRAGLGQNGTRSGADAGRTSTDQPGGVVDSSTAAGPMAETPISPVPVQPPGGRLEGATKLHPRQVSDEIKASVPALPTSDTSEQTPLPVRADSVRDLQPAVPMIVADAARPVIPDSSHAAARVAEAPAGQIAPALVALAHAPDGAQRMTLRLQPSELGQVEIRIDRPAEGPARVEITVERPETLTLLLRDQPQLQRALDHAGVPPEGRSLTFHIVASEPPSNAGSQADNNPAGSNLANGSPTWSGPGGDNGGSGGNAARQGTGESGGGGGNGLPDPDQPVPHWLRAGLDITA
jgi:uncharacterized membrane protein YgcG